MSITLHCEVCDRAFCVSPSRANARFCSTTCYGKWMSENCRGAHARNWRGGKVEHTCRECGRTYYRGKTVVTRFCCRACTDKWKSKHRCGENHPDWIPKIQLTCKQCGKVFDVLPSMAKIRVFCSKVCSARWQGERQREEDNTNWKGGKVTCICEYCGKEFKRDPCQVDTARFCSRYCLAKSRVMENAPNWRGGLSFEEYPPEFDTQFKTQIRERDHHTCAVCKLHGRHIHHIDYDKMNTVPENCITLCRRCHTTTNFNRDYWQTTLERLMSVRSEVAISQSISEGHHLRLKVHERLPTNP